MAGAREPRHKVSRRFGVDIYGTGGAALVRRLGSAPGAVPRRRRRESQYAAQLREKQKAKAFYGVAERQFRRYFADATRQPGPPGENLLRLLERRLDNVVYRLGFARTRPMARQLVAHGHVLVDGKRVTIPSYLVEPGHTVALAEEAARIPNVVEEMEANRPLPGWLERGEGASGRVTRAPERAEIELPIDEALIVAHYSR